MTRHDIRLRRGSFTSRSIEKHKNYRQLLHRHKKKSRVKTFKLFALLLGIAVTAYFLMILIGRF